MSEFSAITTQEELDAVIGDRLRRSEEKWQKKFEGFMSPDDVTAKTSELEKQISDLTNALDGANKKAAAHEKELAERDSKIKGYELSATKHKVAHELGLAYDAIGFLQGEDEESIKASGEALKNLVGAKHSSVEFNNEPNTNNKNDSIKKLAQSLVPKSN
ncbi:MAG: DUF4355 domain-containing protein [Prevotellaceae bacterium]|nr:DUF4355 domain-containing protein [Prevotellaceae bacterium]